MHPSSGQDCYSPSLKKNRSPKLLVKMWLRSTKCSFPYPFLSSFNGKENNCYKDHWRRSKQRTACPGQHACCIHSRPRLPDAYPLDHSLIFTCLRRQHNLVIEECSIWDKHLKALLTSFEPGQLLFEAQWAEAKGKKFCSTEQTYRSLLGCNIKGRVLTLRVLRV